MAKEQNNKRITLAKFVIASLLSLAASTMSWAERVTIVDLRYADAHEVAASLDGLLEEGATVSVYQDKLLIKATPEHTAELKAIIEVLDTAPRNLLISVKQPRDFNDQQTRFKASGQFGDGGTRTAVNPDGTITESRSNITVQQRGSYGQSNASHSVKALEGRDAYIRIGESIPYTYVTRDNYGRPVERVTYRDVTSGFWVNARLSGDRVLLSVLTSNDKAQKETIKVEGVSTRVNGQLGQWIPIGNLSQGQRSTNTGILEYENAGSYTGGMVYIKVDLLD